MGSELDLRVPREGSHSLVDAVQVGVAIGRLASLIKNSDLTVFQLAGSQMILHRLVTAAKESGLVEKYGGVIIAVSSCVEYEQLELHLKTSPSGELIMQVVAFGVRIMHAFTGLRQPVVDLAKNMGIPLQEGTLPYDEPGHELRAQIFEIEPNTYTAGLVLPSELTIGDLVTMLRENADTLLAMRRRGNAANN